MSDRHYVHHENEVQLAKLLKESKPFFERYGTTMIYGVAALMAIAAVVVYVQRRPAPTAAASRDLLLATTAEDYQAVADESPDSPIGILARLLVVESERSGHVAGNLYFISTLGSAIGTLATSFYLVLWFEVNQILITMSITLALAGVIAIVYGSTAAKNLTRS